ncbi:MAG: hypothetical protein KF784_13350 [Fimbriimonadaceae bacterium]|nr:hypothetical protein [Fimbriimonadaceae bacterium]
MPYVLAAVDIGSNTTHLLVASVDNGAVKRLTNESDWLSLGEIVSRTGEIPNATAERIIQSLDAFKKRAKVNGATGVYAFATEAMRSARNHVELLDRIKDRIGLQVDIISPQREAELSLKGVALDSLGPSPMLLIEVGGGSAQIARCVDGQITHECSLPIGTGRLIAQASVVYPSNEVTAHRIEEIIHSALDACEMPQDTVRAVVSGGVARGLWRALHPDGDRVLSIEELRYLTWAATRLTVDEICARFNVKTKRASTLLPGSIVYRCLLERFEHREMLVSQYGVREGAVLELKDGNIVPCPL